VPDFVLPEILRLTLVASVLSIHDLSRQTGLEESLIRYYESEYPTELPEKILQGNSLFFETKAVAAFRRVHLRHSGQPTADQALAKKSEGFARVLAVTSGKGGVGKTNIALNLAIELQRLGKMTLVLDADLGMANIHLLTGLHPKHTLKDILSNEVLVSDLIMDGPEGIGIIPGGSGILGLADATTAERTRMVEALGEMEEAADIIVVDTGAGMAAGVRDFLMAADQILFVLTPDLTSMADAYGLLKALHGQGCKGRLYSVINMVTTLRQAADVARRFGECVERFLGQQVVNMGYLLKDGTVGAATAKRMPYAVLDPKARVSRNTANLAAALVQESDPQVKLSSAFKRYLGMMSGK